MVRGIDHIESENILFSNLARDSFHINESSSPKFCGNLSDYLRYCQQLLQF